MEKNEKKNDLLKLVPEELHEELYNQLKGKFENKDMDNNLMKAVKTYIDQKNNQKTELGGRDL